jgi:hypothetical protein
MITDTTVQLWQKVTTKNGKGQAANTFPLLTKSIQANIQPVSLNQAQLAQWGVTDLAANSKKMFYYPDDDARMLDRIIDAYGRTYEIRGINQWGVPPFDHYEALLMPAQGE